MLQVSARATAQILDFSSEKQQAPTGTPAQKCYHSVRAVKATLSTNQPVIITQPHV